MALIVTPGQLNRRAELYHQLGSMITAGMPLIKSLEMISVRPGLMNSRKTFLELINHLQSGKTFTESMMGVQGWLPEFDMALLSVGEKTGRLDTCFKLLGLYYSFRATIIRDTITGSLITIATLHVFLLVFPLKYMVSFAMGLLNGNYAECIPFLIQKGVVFGSLYLAVFLLVFACQGRRGESWRSLVETFSQLIPILRTAQRYLVLSRLTAALSALTNAGVSIVNGWQLAAAACGSPRLRAEVTTWKEEMETGTTPAELVNRSGYFPALFANLYSTGEQSGKLDDTLERLQTYFQDEGFRRLRVFTRIMNGTIYGLVALLVAYNIVQFYAGYFSNAMQGLDIQ